MTDKPDTPSLQHPPPGEAVLPLPRNMTRLRWTIRLGIWLMLAVLLGLFLRYDTALMAWRCRVFPAELKGWWAQALFGFRDFGQVMPPIVAILIALCCDRRRWFILAAVLFAQVLANAGFETGKYVVDRYRPYAAVESLGDPSLSLAENFSRMSPQSTWLGINPQLRPEATRSFPSGHSGAAFALAGVLAWFHPRARWVFWGLALGCAFSRFMDMKHWASDCLVGGTIGYCGAWLALRPYAFALPVIWYRRRIKRRQAAVRSAGQ